MQRPSSSNIFDLMPTGRSGGDDKRLRICSQRRRAATFLRWRGRKVIRQVRGGGNGVAGPAWKQVGPLVAEGEQAAWLQAEHGSAVGNAPCQLAGLSLNELARLVQESFADHRPAATRQSGELDLVSCTLQKANRGLADLRLIEGRETVIQQNDFTGSAGCRRRFVPGKPTAEMMEVQWRQAAAAVDAAGLFHEPPRQP